MYLVQAARWHAVRHLPTPEQTPTRYCSVCGSAQLRPSEETVLDAGTRLRYRVVRCHGCGYDLLEPLPAASSAAS
jgi:hypothetical protein